MLPPRGWLFIFLNAVRVFSIIGLLLVFSSNVVVLANDIKAVNRFVAEGSNHQMTAAINGTLVDCDLEYIEGSTVPNQPAGVFWAVVNRLLIIFQVIVLLLSEFGWPQVFFNKFFPVLGQDFGLGPLGIFECLIGAAVLSHHVSTFAMVSAFFLFSVGCLNIFMGLVFRGKGRTKRSILSWKENSKSILPTVTNNVRSGFHSPPPSFVSSLFSGQNGGNSSDAADKSNGKGFARQLDKPGYGFDAKGEKAAGLKGFLITKPLETLPRYASKHNGGSPDASSPPHLPPGNFSSSQTAI